MFELTKHSNRENNLFVGISSAGVQRDLRHEQAVENLRALPDTLYLEGNG